MWLRSSRIPAFRKCIYYFIKISLEVIKAQVEEEFQVKKKIRLKFRIYISVCKSHRFFSYSVNFSVVLKGYTVTRLRK